MDQPEPKKRRLEGMSVEDRLRRSRERNREHARRTRQRKKAQLQTLQSRVAELQEEGRRLEEAFKDCSALESISFPPSLITLGKDAFSGCVSLDAASQRAISEVGKRPKHAPPIAAEGPALGAPLPAVPMGPTKLSMLRSHPSEETQ